MKRNKLFIAGLVTVFVALCSLTLVSSTWAKYTSTASGTDTARVAYWGFGNAGQTLAIDGLFAESYVTGSGENAKTNVAEQQGGNIIAPGTSGSAIFAFAYADADETKVPEVAYTFTVDTTGSSIDEAIEDNSNIQWKLDNGEWGTWDALLAAIKTLSGELDGSVDYAPGDLPDAFKDAETTHTISWQWLFDGNDVTDTAMGNLGTASVTLKITITATQID